MDNQASKAFDNNFKKIKCERGRWKLKVHLSEC